MADFEVDVLDDEILSRTAEAVRLAIKDAGGLDGLAWALKQRLGAVDDCPIKVVDALHIAFQSIDDTGSADPDSVAWNGYEADEERVLNQALYHLGQHGDCGEDCTAL